MAFGLPFNQTRGPLFVPTKTRPGWVWFIFIWNTFAFVVAARLMYLVLSGSLPLTQQAKASLAKTTLGYVLGIVSSLLVESAAVALFLLRRQATYLFWSALGAGIAGDVFHLLLNDGIRVHGTWLLVYLATQVTICVYCEHLKRKGTLT
jgi:hypothetical protein